MTLVFFYFRPKARGIIDKINIDFILSSLKEILMLTFSRGCQIVIFQTLKDLHFLFIRFDDLGPCSKSQWCLTGISSGHEFKPCMVVTV